MGNNGSRGLPFYSIPMPLRSLHSFCSVPSHLLKSLERQILRIWEQREDFTPYLGIEGGFYSVFGNRGSITIWREQRKLEIWTCQWEGVSPMHACMHATCNMQHSHVHMDARNTHAPMRHTAHDATHTLTLKCSTYSLRPWKTVHLEIYTLTRV